MITAAWCDNSFLRPLNNCYDITFRVFSVFRGDTEFSSGVVKPGFVDADVTHAIKNLCHEDTKARRKMVKMDQTLDSLLVSS
jgi:hypothetical protein